MQLLDVTDLLEEEEQPSWTSSELLLPTDMSSPSTDPLRQHALATGWPISQGTDPRPSVSDNRPDFPPTENARTLEIEYAIKHGKKMEKVRQNAAASRQRKKEQLEELQKRCIDLEKVNKHLNAQVRQLRAENAALQLQLKHFNRGESPGYSLFKLPKAPAITLPFLTPRRTEEQPTNTEDTDNKRPKKRVRGTITASTAFMALFSLFMIAGPYIPGASSDAQLLALPAASRAVDFVQPQPLAGGTARSLLGLPESEEHSNIEEHILKHLKELGPAALLLETADEKVGLTLGYPQMAEMYFKSAGVFLPQTCQKVLEIDASAIPRTGKTKRSMERLLLGSTGFKGRSLTAESLPHVREDGPLVVPHLMSGTEHMEEQEEVGRSASAVVVSLLLPANATATGDIGGLQSVDKAFVVTLSPEKQFTVHKCSLPRAVFI